MIAGRGGKGAGCSGIRNLLTCSEDMRMFQGGGQEAVAKLVRDLNALDD